MNSIEQLNIKQCLFKNFLSCAFTKTNKTAIVFRNTEISYHDLLIKINCIACFLKKNGVVEGSSVAIYLHRTDLMIAAIFAIHACNAIYIPLDKKYPKEHCIRILKSGSASVVISDETINFFESVPILNLKEVAFDFTDDMSLEKLWNFKTDPNQIAYKICTSGSTGIPKCIPLTHRNALSMIQWAHQCFSDAELEQVLFSTSICFDLSIFEIFVPLLKGKSISICDDFFDFVDNAQLFSNVTLINTVPTAIHYALEKNILGSMRSLKTINLAGEALKQSIVDKIYTQTSVEKIYNLYGPSETTTYSTFYLAKANEKQMNVPIGVGIFGTEILLLDENLSPVPPRVVGEIYISGPGLSSGYLNDQEKNKESFLEYCDPITGTQRKIYKTGDFGRKRLNGIIEYVGRKDDLVKIRGYRIELQHIDSIAQSFPGVKYSASISKKRNAEDFNEEIVQYLEIEKENTFSHELYSEFMKANLPLYMHPSVYTFVDEMPLNLNGKINKNHLKSLQFPTEELFYFTHDPLVHSVILDDLSKRNFDPLHIEIQNIWNTLLHRPINFNSHFFSSGGNSLHAASCAAELVKKFKIQVSVSDIFKYPRFKDFCEHIKSRLQNDKFACVFSDLIDDYNEKNINHNLIPVTNLQKSLYYLQNVEIRKEISNMPIIMKIMGDLCYEKLDRAFNAVVKKHPILNAVFVIESGTIYQKECDAFEQTLNVIDISFFKNEIKENKLNAILKSEILTGFNLQTGPLLRAILIKTSQKEHVLLMNIHHIVMDAISLEIIKKDLFDFYTNSHIQSNQFSFFDYAKIQNNLVDSNIIEKDFNFWTQELNELPASSVYQLSTKRPAKFSYEGSCTKKTLSSDIIKQIEEFCLANGITENTLLNFTFHALMSYVSGQKYFVTGALFGTRNFRETQNMVGFFVNALPLRFSVQNDRSVLENLSLFSSKISDVMEHSHITLDDIIEKISYKKEPSLTPIFQNLFTYIEQNDHLSIDNLTIETFEFERFIAKYDTTWSFIKSPGNLDLFIEYYKDLYRENDIEFLITKFNLLLDQILKNPGSLFKEISFCDETDSEFYRQLDLVSFAYDKQNSIDELFCQNALSNPHKPALICNTEIMTYEDLNIHSDKIAAYLKMMGVTPGQCVAISLPRGFDYISAALGVLKVGAYYLPLSQKLPDNRRNQLIQWARVNVVIDFSTFEIINALHVQDNFLQKNSLSTDIAYLMFTSGSTGEPKGVRITHNNVVQTLKQSNYLNIQPDDVLIHLSDVAFDASCYEIWGALINGASLVLPAGDLFEISTVSNMIKEYHVSKLFLTTQLFNVFVDVCLDSLYGIKDIYFGGEKASLSHIKKFFNSKKDSVSRLYNIYGPTEVTIFSLFHEIQQTDLNDHFLPIGRSIYGTKSYVLNADKKLCPRGVLGELYLGGSRLAVDYFELPNETNSSFVHMDIFEESTRLYKTGDIVFLNNQGNIVYVKRQDDQTKISGFRIECAEIDSCISTFSDQFTKIKTVVAFLNTDKAALVSFVNSELPFVQSDLLSHCRTFLPQYMVPKFIVTDFKIELNKNGKTDSHVLIAYAERMLLERNIEKSIFAENTEKIQKQIDQPSSICTHIIEEVWNNVLETKSCASDENFFDLGGNSLKVIVFVDELQKKLNPFNLKFIPGILDVFEYPTLDQIKEEFSKNNQYALNR